MKSTVDLGILRSKVLLFFFVVLPLVSLAIQFSPASAQQQSLYSEGFESVAIGVIPTDWTVTSSSFNSDHIYGVASDAGILGNISARSYKQAKVGITLPVGSTIYKQFDIPLSSSISGSGTITLKSAFYYTGLPSVGANYFCWRLVGGPSEFRICMEVNKYTFRVTAGDSGGVTVGDPSVYENQWNTLEAVYNLGETNVQVRVNNGVPQTIPAYVAGESCPGCPPEPPPTPFTSATTSILDVVNNFGQTQTGAIYIDDLEITFEGGVAKFAFEKIADTDTLMPGYSGTFGGANAFSAPSLDGPYLAFMGNNNGIHGYKAVYVVSGNTFTVVADTNTPIPGDSGLDFRDFNNDQVPISLSGGNVVFKGSARTTPVPTGIYQYIGGSLNIVADRNTPTPNDTGNFTTGFGTPDVDGGTVVFCGAGEGGQEGIYTVNGGSLQVVADLDTLRPGTTVKFESLYPCQVDTEGSDVVFRATDLYGVGVYTTVGGSLRMVADVDTLIPGQTSNFSSFGESLIDGGNVVFHGARAGFHGIYVDHGGQLSVLVDSSTQVPEAPIGRTFFQFITLSQNNGRLAFVGSQVDNGTQKYGLYMIDGGELIKILDFNDVLDGKTPFYYKIAREGLNGSDIAFAVIFTDGSEGIYVAHYSSANEPPTAVAGDDQSIRAGDTVFLDGSGSFDDNTASIALSYAWAFSSLPVGSIATLSDADTATPSFDADVAGTYAVELVVTDADGISSIPDVAEISSDNMAPTAVAGNDQLVIVDDTVFFDGSGSTDPEFDLLTYAWTITSAPMSSTAALSDASTAFPTFMPDLEGIYVVSLVVSDFIGPGTPDTVEITATTPVGYAEVQIVSVADIVTALGAGEVTTLGNQNAFGNFLSQATIAIQEGDIDEAIDKLNKAIARTDGCALRGAPDDGNGKGRDWITDCAAQTIIYESLTDALGALTP